MSARSTSLGPLARVLLPLAALLSLAAAATATASVARADFALIALGGVA
jgi:hypothetical protein